MAKGKSKHNKGNKIHYQKSKIKIAFFVVIIFFSLVFIVQNNKISKIFYSDTQILIDNKNITKELKDNVKYENNQVYLSFEDIKTFIDNNLYFEEESGTYITTSEKKLANFKKNENSMQINGATVKVENPIIEEDGKDFIAISEMKSVYDYEFEYIPITNIVTIDNFNKKKETANLKKDVKVKEKNNIISKKIEKLKKDEEIIIIEKIDKNARIRTKNGNIGFISIDSLTNIITIREDFSFETNRKNEENEYTEFNLTDKDITTFEKRKEIIDLILQQAIKNGNMYVKIIYDKKQDKSFERFQIEAKPVLKECGINFFI